MVWHLDVGLSFPKSVGSLIGGSAHLFVYINICFILCFVIFCSFQGITRGPHNRVMSINIFICGIYKTQAYGTLRDRKDLSFTGHIVSRMQGIYARFVSFSFLKNTKLIGILQWQNSHISNQAIIGPYKALFGLFSCLRGYSSSICFVFIYMGRKATHSPKPATQWQPYLKTGFGP